MPRNFHRFIFPVALLLAACSSVPEGASEPVVTRVLECGTFDYVARTEGDKLWLFMPGETRVLNRDAEGRYRQGDWIWQPEGDRFRLEGWREDSFLCRNNPRKAAWEHAKLNGVDFRAVGQEPPWILELSREHAQFWLGYERAERVFRVTELLDGSGEGTLSRFRLEGDGETWQLQLSPGPCRDPMSGEPFATRVLLDTGAEHYRGCGNALH